MADAETIWVKLGQPYLFTKAQYEYCASRGAPVAVVYYDSKTSAASRRLYDAVFSSKAGVQALHKRLTQQEKYEKGYCCLFVLDRQGRINGGDPDLDFFAQEALRSDCSYGNSYRLPVLAASFGGTTCCMELPDAAGADDLAAAIYDKCESGECGLGSFAGWTGRGEWLSRQPRVPPPETPPDKKGKDSLNAGLSALGGPAFWFDAPGKKEYADYDPGYDGSFGGVPAMSPRFGGNTVLDLADVSTPDTTYVLIGSYDMKNKTSCPKDSRTKFKPYMEPYSDHVVEIWNTDCIKANGGFKDKFTQGGKYRFFVFYEFSHGYEKAEPDGHHEITIGVSYADIWNTFKDMRPDQRVWGQFDSCYSGSVIQHSGANGGFKAATAKPQDILDYLDAKFRRRATLLQAVTGGQTTAEQASATYDTRMILWSSTTPSAHGWYYSTSGTTVYMQGFGNAMSTEWWKKHKFSEIRYGYADDSAPGTGGKQGSQAFPEVQRNGYSTQGGAGDICIPRCRNYPADSGFKTNIIFT